jgi:DMSO/TMAO reductase YedYZ molybdopterin-dependent catalytic subunit
MTTDATLPPGQRQIESFPRFGLIPFAVRFPSELGAPTIRISGNVRTSVEIGAELASLTRVDQCSDFHCVTTWTHRALHWSGFRFAEFYQRLVVPLAGPAADATFVVLRAQDGGRSSLPLADLMAADVLLADRLHGQPLSIAHGAPLRLVAPAHYGYKSVKHLDRIEFWRSGANYRPVGFRFMVHPRARVAQEERGQWLPGWLLRTLYRPLIRPTASRFERALQKHLAAPGRDTT